MQYKYTDWKQRKRLEAMSLSLSLSLQYKWTLTFEGCLLLRPGWLVVMVADAPLILLGRLLFLLFGGCLLLQPGRLTLVFLHGCYFLFGVLLVLHPFNFVTTDRVSRYFTDLCFSGFAVEDLYCPPSEASEGYVFTGVCHFNSRGEVAKCQSPRTTPPPLDNMVNGRVVRILLECILVCI